MNAEDLVRATLILSAALMIVLVLRIPVRSLFGARAAYSLWLLAPAATLASFIPARLITVQGGGMVSAPSENFAAFAFAPAVLGLWAAGAIVGLVVLALQHRRLMSRLRPSDGGYDVADNLGPAVIGILRPRIVLPSDFEQRYSPAERALVLEHERVHLNGFDPQINAIAALTLCLMWFNPVVHIARACLRVDQELACDARVIARHSRAARCYAEAMLKSQLTAGDVALGCAWPPLGARALNLRISMLSQSLGKTRQVLGNAVCALAAGGASVAAWASQPPRIVVAPSSVSALASPPPAPTEAVHLEASTTPTDEALHTPSAPLTDTDKVVAAAPNLDDSAAVAPQEAPQADAVEPAPVAVVTESADRSNVDMGRAGRGIMRAFGVRGASRAIRGVGRTLTPDGASAPPSDESATEAPPG